MDDRGDEGEHGHEPNESILDWSEAPMEPVPRPDDDPAQEAESDN